MASSFTSVSGPFLPPSSPASPSIVSAPSIASRNTQARTISIAYKSNDVQMSVEVSGLIKAIQKHGPVRTVQAHLHGLTKSEKAIQVVDMLNLHHQQGEVLALIVSHVWNNFVVPEKLWQYYEGGKDQFKEDVSYNEFIAPTLASVNVSQGRKERHISRLERKWGSGWEKTIDMHSDHPTLLSEHYLRIMGKLASSGMTLSDAKQVLDKVVERRILHPRKGVRAQRSIMVSDIQKVVSAVTAVSSSQNILPEQCTPAQLDAFICITEGATQRVTELDTPRFTLNAPPPSSLSPVGGPSFSDVNSAMTLAQEVSHPEASVIDGNVALCSAATHIEAQAALLLAIAQQPTLAPTLTQYGHGFGTQGPAFPAREELASRASILDDQDIQPASTPGRPVSHLPSRPCPTPLASPPHGSPRRSPRMSPYPEQRVNGLQVPATDPISQGVITTVTPQFSFSSESPSQPTLHGQVLPGFSNALSAPNPVPQEVPGCNTQVLSPVCRPSLPLRGTMVLSPDMMEDKTSGLDDSEPRSSLNLLPPSPLSSSTGTGPVPSPARSRLSTPEKLVSRTTTPPLQLNDSSPAITTAVPHCEPLPVPISSDSRLPNPSGSTGQCGGILSLPSTLPLVLIEPGTKSPGLQSNSPDLTPPPRSQGQLASRKRRYIESTSQHSGIRQSSLFKLEYDWVDNTPVGSAIRRQGFYTSTDALQFANSDCPTLLLNELSLYERFGGPLDDGRLNGCFHSLLQQALVQNPHVYLTALAAMETTNHRLISLPVPPIVFPSSEDSPLMDPCFPFAKYLQRERSVTATRILYSLGDAKIRIGSNMGDKAAVKGWWDKCGGNLNVAASALPFEPFSTAQLHAGEFVAMPPQLLWYVELNFPTGSRSSPQPLTSNFVEVRYISVTPNGELDFDYWPDGTYDQISRYNRDLLAPTVTGWGADAAEGGNRFKGAIEMRGVWAIGDALLGLMSWHSPLVQLELRQLFDAPPGHWFNNQFVKDVQTRFDEKLAGLVETMQLVYNREFG